MSSRTIVTDLSTRSGWTYGGVRYGLEPLTLPSPEAADADETGHQTAVPSGYDDARRSILRTDWSGGLARRGDDESVDELFWFRWITGHQVSFVIWRLMAQVVRGLRLGKVSPPAAQESLGQHIRGYCAMLLYTSSCSREIYQRLIRPSMYLQHRSFSGSWAPDFRPVRDLFRGRPLTALGGPDSVDLAPAVKLYQAVHDGVMVKLVPDGRSMLQNSAAILRSQAVRLPDPALLGVLYDNYFLTLRAPVCRPDVVAQLVRRLVAVSQDLAMNGLYPSNVAGAGDKPSALEAPEVVECERDLTRVLFGVASLAIGGAAGDAVARARWLAGFVRTGDVA